MWQTKLFKTAKACENFIRKHERNYQINIIYVNNAYGIEYKPLRKF